MEIKTLEIKNIVGVGMKGNCEAIRHIKSLPCLSVVQPVHGYYEIGLDGKIPVVIEEGGAFIAPAGVQQDIIHHNGTQGYMEAQWVFLSIVINDCFAFEDLFDVPVRMSARQCLPLYELIYTVRTTADICKKYAAAYQITDLLMAQSAVKDFRYSDTAAQLKKYIDGHYSEAITGEELANAVFCSVPNLYRIFRKYFHLSPHNYVNKIRLEKAAMLLENGTDPVMTVAERVGFDDPVYFSKLFKEKYRLSPKKYRETIRNVNQ